MQQTDLKMALDWYIQGFDLITIAQHFSIDVETLKKLLNNVNH
jgi:DNA-binding CsgD family transcriptional regulator